MQFTAALLSTIALLATSASAHGGVGVYTFGGKDWPGWQPYNSATGQSTIQRQYSSYDPILTPTGTNIRCNNAGQTSTLHGSIAAGSQITAQWTQWTHAEGPVTVYMAKCPASCADFDGSGAVWFKIDEAGLISGTVNQGRWGNTVVLETLKWTSTIPAALAPGNYLVRHELLALHQANTPQFYPECAQLTVTGSGTESPSGEYVVSLPGAFSMSDPGVNINIYSSTATTYQVPGPKVWTGSGGKASTVVSPTTAATTRATTAPTTAASSAPPAATTTAAAGGTVAVWGQCGGTGYTGATACASSTCVKLNDYYSQCQ